MSDLKTQIAILHAARHLAAYQEMSKITVARADALRQLHTESQLDSDKMLAAIIEACFAGVIAERNEITVNRARDFFVFLRA